MPLKINTVLRGHSLWSGKNSFEVSGARYLERRLLIGAENSRSLSLTTLTVEDPEKGAWQLHRSWTGRKIARDSRRSHDEVTLATLALIQIGLM